jgi:hypothetical protein
VQPRLDTAHASDQPEAPSMQFGEALRGRRGARVAEINIGLAGWGSYRIALAWLSITRWQSKRVAKRTDNYRQNKKERGMDRLLQDAKRKCVVLCFLQASITMLISKRAWALEEECSAHGPSHLYRPTPKRTTAICLPCLPTYPSKPSSIPDVPQPNDGSVAHRS